MEREVVTMSNSDEVNHQLTDRRIHKSKQIWKFMILIVLVMGTSLMFNLAPVLAPNTEMNPHISVYHPIETAVIDGSNKGVEESTATSNNEPQYTNPASKMPQKSPESKDLKLQQSKDMTSVEVEKKSLNEEENYYLDHATAIEVIQARMTLIPNTVAPGDVLLVRHQQPITIEWQARKYTLQKFGQGYYSYVPIPISIEPGVYPIGELMLTIVPKEFKTQFIQVTEQMETMQQNTVRIESDQAKINKARSNSASTFLFSSVFTIPLEGRLTTPFGYMRYVNNKFSSSHRALDIAAPEGTPIKATNDGIVGLADTLYLTGESIYIDHGMHLFSQYAHMSKVIVKTGDTVKRGDIIGYVGTTGFSTGPHLHFTFWAHNTPVNPNLFLETTPFQWTSLSVDP
jgi:murein DD-endopeptidase MepM/ murein hydrolase activator NlpD